MTDTLGITRPLTSRAMRALTLSDAAAADLGEEFVGTEHLRLGLLGDSTAPASQILASLGVSKVAVIAALQDATRNTID